MRGRGSSRQFTEYAQKTSGGLLVRKRFERNRGGKMGRFGTKTHADQAVSAGCNQSVDHRRKFLGPVTASGKHHWSRARNRPIARARRQIAVPLRQPAVTEDIELEAGGATQICLKGKSFFLFVP